MAHYPTANFTTAINGLTVAIDTSSSHAASGSLTIFYLTWGDGTIRQSYTPIMESHTYALSGTYTIKLTVTQTNGLSRSKTAKIRVLATSLPSSPPPPPVTLVSLSITGTLSGLVGSVLTLGLNGTYSDGTVAAVTSAPTWTSDKTQVASVNIATALPSLISLLSAGTANITSTLTGISTTSSVSVSAPIAVPPSAPSSPSPSNLALAVGSPQTLSWSSNATSYTVAFGTSSPPPTVATGVLVPSYAVPPLSSATVYYWQITAINAAGSTVGPIWQFTSATFAPPTPPGAQRTLSMSDLTWLGTFKSPTYLAANGGSVTYPFFTLRRVGGVLKTLWLTADHGGFAPPNELIQVDYPGNDPVLANAPLASANFRNFGNGWLAHALTPDGVPPPGLFTSGIVWDDANNCVWVQYYDAYNTSGRPDPVLVRGDINDAAPDATAVTWSGPWRLSGTVANSVAQANSHQTQSYLVTVPPSYGSAHLNGATIALGGGFSSGASMAAYSNVLWAPSVTPQNGTPTTPAGGADLPAVCLLGGDSSSSHRGRRPGDYTTDFCPAASIGDLEPTSYTRSALTGYWGALDGVGSAVWLSWDTVQGVLFFVAHGRGHIWYNNSGLQGGIGQCQHGVIDRYFVTGPESVVSIGNDSNGNPEPPIDTGKVYGSGPDIEAALYAYDPTNFVPVAGGSPWQVPVHDWAYCLDAFPNFAVSKDVGARVIIRPNAIAADETARLIMIPCGYVTGGVLNGIGFYVNVFSVAP